MLDDGAFREVTDVAAMDSVAPTAAHRTRCGTHRTADLHGDHAGALLDMQYALADTGKESLKPGE